MSGLWPVWLLTAVVVAIWLRDRHLPEPVEVSNDTRRLPSAKPRHRGKPAAAIVAPVPVRALPKRIPGAALNASVEAEIAGWVA